MADGGSRPRVRRSISEDSFSFPETAGGGCASPEIHCRTSSEKIQRCWSSSLPGQIADADIAGKVKRLPRRMRSSTISTEQAVTQRAVTSKATIKFMALREVGSLELQLLKFGQAPRNAVSYACLPLCQCKFVHLPSCLSKEYSEIY